MNENNSHLLLNIFKFLIILCTSNGFQVYPTNDTYVCHKCKIVCENGTEKLIPSCTINEVKDESQEETELASEYYLPQWNCNYDYTIHQRCKKKERPKPKSMVSSWLMCAECVAVAEYVF